MFGLKNKVEEITRGRLEFWTFCSMRLAKIFPVTRTTFVTPTVPHRFHFFTHCTIFISWVGAGNYYNNARILKNGTVVTTLSNSWSIIDMHKKTSAFKKSTMTQWIVYRTSNGKGNGPKSVFLFTLDLEP